MKLCCFTAHSAEYAPLAALTEPDKSLYCTRYGYDFRVALLDSTDSREAGFERFEKLMNCMTCGSYDWIYWSGTDVLLTNHDKPLERLLTDGPESLVIATDANGLQNDSFLVRPCPNIKSFFTEIFRGKQFFIELRNREQDAMEELARERYQREVRFVPQRELGGFDYNLYHHLGENYVSAKDKLGSDGQWQPGDFAIHWPALPLEQRIELVKEKLASL